MQSFVEPVPVDLLIRANDAVSRNAGQGLADVSIIAEFANELRPDTIIALSYRLRAMAMLAASPVGAAWTLNVRGKPYKLVSEAFFAAAAEAPLEIEPLQLVGEISFDPQSFLEYALTKARTAGSA
jgi:hypothetical protein